MTAYQLPLGIAINAAPFEKRVYPFGVILSVPIYAIEALASIRSKTSCHIQ